MARIIGGLGVSHVPAIGNAIAKGLQQDAYWKPFFDGFPAVHDWLARTNPDVAVCIYNDHGLNFFLDKLPTFAVGAAPEYRNADEGWGLPVQPPLAGDVKLSWHIIEELIGADFDITTCQEVAVDHALVIPLQLFWPNGGVPPRIVPIMINTVQHPLPGAARCFRLGQAVGRAIEAYDENIDVVVIGTGGLSHQLDGARAGFINKAFDRECLDHIAHEPDALTLYSIHDLVKLSGSQGVEILNWIAMRGALTGRVEKLHENYHVPISNTASGLVLLENV